jgi:hypothetical protein
MKIKADMESEAETETEAPGSAADAGKAKRRAARTLFPRSPSAVLRPESPERKKGKQDARGLRTADCPRASSRTAKHKMPGTVAETDTEMKIKADMGSEAEAETEAPGSGADAGKAERLAARPLFPGNPSTVLRP